MNVSIIGPGRWGSFQTWYQSHIGNTPLLYGLASDPIFQELSKTRKNEYLTLQENVSFTTDLNKTLENDIIIISIPSQRLRGLCNAIKDTKISLKDKIFVLCMKGIETETGKRLSQIMHDELDGVKPVVLVGPGHVQSLTNKIPTCMVIDSNSENNKKIIFEKFSSPLIRLYEGCDLVGSEIGAATKNIIGIVAGMLDGMKYTELKGALMARGTYEISKLIQAAGGNKMSAYGLAHLGDYEATLFSKYSHNRMYGEKFINGEIMEKHAEGVETLKAIITLKKQFAVEMPICETLYEILFENRDFKEAFKELFNRPRKCEF